MADDEERGNPNDLDFGQLATMAEPPKPGVDPATLKLEGDAIPEGLRGKTLAEVIAQNAEQQRALEQSKLTLQTLAQSSEALASSRAPAGREMLPPAPPEDKPKTRDELKALYESDPFAYQEYMFAQVEKGTAKRIESAVGGIAVGTADAAEQVARGKYKEEFEVLGPEIKAALDQHVQDRRALAQPGAWDTLIEYVRGKHVDKLFAARESKKSAASLAEAQGAARQSNGVQFDGSRRGGAQRQPATLGAELTKVQQEIAEKMGMSEGEYRKFYIDG